MRFLLNEALLRLIKPLLALLLAGLLFWVATGPIGEPSSLGLALLCWLAATALIMLLETGVI